MKGRTSLADLMEAKRQGHQIVAVSCYDYTNARLVAQTDVDVVLVGDSAAQVILGYDSTLPATMDFMVAITAAVRRAAPNVCLVADMPFMSYQPSVEEGIRNAGRFIKEAGASAVKIEGGAEVAEHITAMTKSDIPVMAHIGLTPQSIHRMGGYKVQGKTEESAKRLLNEAHIAEDAGAFSLLLEAIPKGLAKQITEELSIPTIGIGAGPYCDGQVLVLHDVIGLFERFLPKFAKRYTNLKDEALKALITYKEEVEKEIFPSEKESFK